MSTKNPKDDKVEAKVDEDDNVVATEMSEDELSDVAGGLSLTTNFKPTATFKLSPTLKVPTLGGTMDTVYGGGTPDRWKR